MRARILLLLLFVPWAAPASGADLSAIPRTIAKEPVYQTKAPRYCLVVFGPEAKTRVWLVVDGDTLYVDRNGSGDLTEAGKKVSLPGPADKARVFQAGEVTDGTLKHTGLTVMQYQIDPQTVGNPRESERITRESPGRWVWTVGVTAERAVKDQLPKQVRYIANGDGLGYLIFAERPQEAPIVHFNGPWTLGLQDVKQRLTPGLPAMLQIGVGTPGVGPGTFAFVLYPGLIPDRAHPVADVTFPPKMPGGKAVQKQVTLTKRC
jgi:hypothetical protein